MPSQKRPTVEGWWWYRHSDQHVPRCIEVFRDGGSWWASAIRQNTQEWHAIENLGGEWQGPIAMPYNWEI